jgi:hypothetical protein
VDSSSCSDKLLNGGATNCLGAIKDGVGAVRNRGGSAGTTSDVIVADRADGAVIDCLGAIRDKDGVGVATDRGGSPSKASGFVIADCLGTTTDRPDASIDRGGSTTKSFNVFCDGLGDRSAVGCFGATEDGIGAAGGCQSGAKSGLGFSGNASGTGKGSAKSCNSEASAGSGCFDDDSSDDSGSFVDTTEGDVGALGDINTNAPTVGMVTALKIHKIRTGFSI